MKKTLADLVFNPIAQNDIASLSLTDGQVKEIVDNIKSYTPFTGASCGCRKGVQRDNCPNCEGTGKVIDFAAIRARRNS